MNSDTTHTTGLKPILWFIVLTFAATWAIEYSLINNGLRFDAVEAQSSPTLWLLAIMWIPGLSGLLVTLFVEKRSFRELGDALLLRMGSVGPYFLTFIIAPAVFFAIYALTWTLGLSEFDPSMNGLATITGQEISQKTILEIMLPLSIFLGPLINFIFGLGEEIGWRGFLLPRLTGLGKPVAYTILGLLWGLWHAPLIHVGFNYPGHAMSGVLMMCALSFAFGVFLNEMTLHYKSSLLAGFIHGAVNAQGYGVWFWLFPGINPLLGGATGVVAVGVWLTVSALTVLALNRLRK